MQNMRWYKPIHLETREGCMSTRQSGQQILEIRTGAERVVGTLELLAGSEILALGSDTLEVVGVVLEAVNMCELAVSSWLRVTEKHTSDGFGWCWGSEL